MENNTGSKAAYAQPSLQRLGSIISLTAGGSLGTMEGTMMPPNPNFSRT